MYVFDKTVNCQDDEPITVCTGYSRVTLQKMFGPTIFADIRIQADARTCEWVIERQSLKGLDEDIWIEVARIPGQLPDEFPPDY